MCKKIANKNIYLFLNLKYLDTNLALNMTPQVNPSEQSTGIRPDLPGPVPNHSLITNVAVLGVRPCATCENHIEALCLGTSPFNEVPTGVTIRMTCMVFEGVTFSGVFRVIRRNSDVPAITDEALQVLLERNFRTFLIIAQIPM